MSEDTAGQRQARCPICHKPARHAARPFCSRRCAEADLGRWFAGAYVIESRPDEGAEDADDPGRSDAKP